MPAGYQPPRGRGERWSTHTVPLTVNSRSAEPWHFTRASAAASTSFCGAGAESVLNLKLGRFQGRQDGASVMKGALSAGGLSAWLELSVVGDSGARRQQR